MRFRLFVLAMAVVLLLTACGGSSTASRAVPASLHVAAAQVTVTPIPYASRIPVKQLTRFMVKLTSTAGPGQLLQDSLKGGSTSFPPETRGHSLQSAFPQCQVSAVLYVDTSISGVNAVEPTVRSLDDTEADWIVDVTPQSTGTLPISGEIDVRWTCPDGRSPQSQLTTFQQAISVFDPHPVHTVLGDIINNPIVIAVASTLLASFLTWLGVFAWRRITRRKASHAHKKTSRGRRKAVPGLGHEGVRTAEANTSPAALQQEGESKRSPDEEQEIDMFPQAT
jgi:hypothetical protein